MRKFVIKDITHNDYVAKVEELKPTNFKLSFAKTTRTALKFKTEQSADKALMLIVAICPDDEFKVCEVQSNEGH